MAHSYSKDPRKQFKANIFGGGGVVWRFARNGRHRRKVEVVIIHRPKYDDWSFPKGKVDPGEHTVQTAVREIWEESGFQVRLGRFLGAETYPVPGHKKLKRVQYWAAQVVGGEFAPNSEVDEIRWLAPEEAAAHLSYPMDRKILRQFLKMAPDTETMLVVRHAMAGSRKRFKGDDTERPLDREGLEQAEALCGVLAAFGADSIYAADRARCVQTVTPYANRVGKAVQIEPALTEEAYKADPEMAEHRIREIAAAGGVPAVCSQGGVIPDLLAWWAAKDGVELPANRNRKGSVWVLSLRDGKLLAADHIASPLPKVPLASEEPGRKKSA